MSDSVPPPYKQIWRFHEPGSNQGLSSAVAWGGMVYAVGLKAVYAIESSNGYLAWSVPRATGPLTSPAIGTDAKGTGFIVFTEGTGSKTTLAAAELPFTRGGSGPPPATGSAAWTQPLKTDVTGGVTIDGTTVLVGDNGGNLYAFDLATGKPLWERSLGSGLIEAPVVVSDGTVYAVLRNRQTGDVRIVAIDEKSGTVSWIYTPRIAPLTFSPLTVSGGVVYTASWDRRLSAVSTTMHTLLWSTLLRDAVSPISGVAAAGGYVYVSDISGGLYEIDAATGKHIWDYQFNSSGSTSVEFLRGVPAVSGGFVIEGLQDGRLAAVRISDGTLAWIGSTGAGALKPLTVTPDMVIVAKGGKAGGLVAFANDPSGTLTSLVSPTKVQPSLLLKDLTIGAVIAFAALALLFRLTGRFLWATGKKYGTSGDETEIGTEKD